MIYVAVIISYILFSICNIIGVANNAYVRNVLQIVLVLSVSAAYFLYIRKRENKSLYIFAYLIRLGLLFFSVYGRQIAYIPFDGKDTEHFYSAVWEGKDHIEYGIDHLVTVTTYISYLLGDARLLYQYMMLLISMLGIRLANITMIKLSIAKKVQNKCILIASAFPTFAIFGVIYSREAIVSTGTIASFLLFLMFLQSNSRKQWIYLPCSLAVAVIASLFHAAPMAVVLSYVIAILLYDYADDKFKVSKKSIVLTSITVFLIATIFVINPNAFEKLSGITDVKSIAGRFMFESNLNAGSSYAQYVGDSDTWGRFIFYTPVRMFYGMFAPLPWEWRGIVDAGTFFLNSLFYIIVSVLALINVFRRNYWSNFNRWLVLTLMIASAMVGWGCVAFGTSIRHRDKFFLLFLIMLSLEMRGKDKELTLENSDN